MPGAVKIGDMTFGKYACKKKPKKKPAVGVVMLGFPQEGISGMGQATLAMCMAVQPACIKVPMNIAVMGSMMVNTGGTGDQRLLDPVLGIGVPGYTGVGMYITCSSNCNEG